MNRARDGAWKFANTLFATNAMDKEKLIRERDDKIAKFAQSIIPYSWFIKSIFWVVRIGEKGTVSLRIKALEK